MSKKTLTSFMKRLRSDAKLQKDFARFASDHGFAIDADELSETDLDAVAGGIDTIPVPEMPAYRAALRKAVKKSTR